MRRSLAVPLVNSIDLFIAYSAKIPNLFVIKNRLESIIHFVAVYFEKFWNFFWKKIVTPARFCAKAKYSTFD
jgi:hypothetical protein